MILVEGPDNSGKSTLIKQLVSRFDLFLGDRPHGPPKNAIELQNRLLDVKNFYNSKNFILDRNPIIGENIYGPILRGHNMLEEILNRNELESELFSKIRDKSIFLIYCRPPREILLNLETHQVKSYDTKEHLESLSKNQSKIIDAYDKLMSSLGAYAYNYKEPEGLKILIDILRKEYFKDEC